ncbi:hypothetical protein [Ureibacillus sp. FSL W8-0352]|uniref:hypothetical protein n=1 Tax=Ureibacillus sp. FSL W8-0352 TaxID=2954596 RepID=UPI0030F9F9A8
MPVVVAQVIGYSKKMDVYYPRLGVFVFSLKSRKNKTENSDIIYATVVKNYELIIQKKLFIIYDKCPVTTQKSSVITELFLRAPGMYMNYRV